MLAHSCAASAAQHEAKQLLHMRSKPGTSTASGIRGAYESLGVQGFYAAHGHEYVNPHDDQIVKAIALLMDSQQFGEQPGQLRVLDLSCGSGEAYERRTGRSAHGWSFQNIADGCLAARSFDLCVCSFALHLCDSSSLFITLYQLACHCRWLAILAPHKQPAIREEHGWSAAEAWKVDRVHVRLYASLNFGQPLE
ncbi:hypothetical protein COHA_007266 [Chlorella ohadii]|uniref:Methyltransferase domain-containing protein n=1 Tax=Chlorella ohadii TaxID=2649997 RepID=A0AAD5DNI1_9CHLO|nr:hypothetical protein COHA_007266 [Chlorella ohadii]